MSFPEYTTLFLSFEIIPPLRGTDITPVLRTVEELVQYTPPFIDVTSHAAGDGSRRKRPGTLGICALIQHKYGTAAVPHVLCHGFTREETEDFLLESHYLGIDSVLALQGDAVSPKPIPFGRSSNVYAVDLVQQIMALNQGVFLSADEQGTPTEEFEKRNFGHKKYEQGSYFCAEMESPFHFLQNNPQNISNRAKNSAISPPLENFAHQKVNFAKFSTHFRVGIAGYPEKHYLAPDLDTDIAYLKAKVDAGASYIVTQMFFDNQKYFSFVDKCRAVGITVPIIPGLKILTHKKQAELLPQKFSITLPQELRDEINRTSPQAVSGLGCAWTAQQIRELYQAGVSGVHLYVMQDVRPVHEVMKKL